MISWGKSNRSFIIWNPEELSRRILSTSGSLLSPDFTSFFIRLRFYGFKRIKGSGHLEVGDTHFVRGKPELMSNMEVNPSKRRRQELRDMQARKKKDELAREKEVVDRLPFLRI